MVRDLRIERGQIKEMLAEKEEVCGADTDPAMTAAGSTTTRGSGFFCVSLEQGRKVGKDYRVKVERLSHRGGEGDCNTQQLLCTSPNLAKQLAIMFITTSIS